MDRQHREGGKTGSGHGLLTSADQNAHRRQRLMSLAMETVDLANDPFVIKNHLGQLECVLCMTVHTNEGSYLAHTQAKRHLANLARRAAKQAAMNQQGVSVGVPVAVSMSPPVATLPDPQKKKKIGRPEYTLKPVKHEESGALGVLLHVHYPEIISDPGMRIMSAFEQRLEAPNRAYQYLLIAADPYETIAFKIPNRPVLLDNPDLTFTYWDADFKVFTVQVMLSNNP